MQTEFTDGVRRERERERLSVTHCPDCLFDSSRAKTFFTGPAKLAKREPMRRCGGAAAFATLNIPAAEGERSELEHCFDGSSVKTHRQGVLFHPFVKCSTSHLQPSGWSRILFSLTSCAPGWAALRNRRNLFPKNIYKTNKTQKLGGVTKWRNCHKCFLTQERKVTQ